MFDFGPDGALYFSDWVEGWDKPNKGRIDRVFDPSRVSDPKVREVRTLLAEGMDHRPNDELARLLAHPDMRVRQEAQFELAARGKAWLLRGPTEAARMRDGDQEAMSGPRGGWGAISSLRQVALRQGNLLSRLHAIWGLGQLGRFRAAGNDLDPWATLDPLIEDREAEVRAQVAKVLGDLREPKAFDVLIDHLEDDSPRVRAMAAIAVGKLGNTAAVGPLLEMLRRDDGKDPILRHAAVMGLVGSTPYDLTRSERVAGDASPSARMGVLLAMRRLGDPEIARFLKEADPRLVLEAARAINDVPIDGAMAALADLPMTKDAPLPLPAPRAQRSAPAG